MRGAVGGLTGNIIIDSFIYRLGSILNSRVENDGRRCSRGVKFSRVTFANSFICHRIWQTINWATCTHPMSFNDTNDRGQTYIKSIYTKRDERVKGVGV